MNVKIKMKKITNGIRFDIKVSLIGGNNETVIYRKLLDKIQT